MRPTHFLASYHFVPRPRLQKISFDSSSTSTKDARFLPLANNARFLASCIFLNTKSTIWEEGACDSFFCWISPIVLIN